MSEYVILVDERDNPLGLMEKMEAHEKGLLHRAISVFVLNENNELMLQQRAFSKYHSGGLWTNTCCTHPRDGETPHQASLRRLNEEMGFTCSLNPAFSFTYKAKFDNDLIEHEFDHVFIGRVENNTVPVINPEEVENWKWMSLSEIENDIHKNPSHYTEWFKIVFDQFLKEVSVEK
ncbi:MAG: isopentenyl-diphosphate Delta-isomerase [Flavobacteriales bacterium]|nr:MAG: isopentenyl-diphosphate Delta-isomerase [Flavobacteriales bacterium]